eukprot:COSAG05_NODE_3124_length_2306_cov_1.653829_2_plen_157_part_00
MYAYGRGGNAGKLKIYVFDGSDCPCGTYTPVNPWNGAGVDCTCPTSRCATKAKHYLEYPVRVEMNESTAPCVSVVRETAQERGGDKVLPCKSQRWFLTPVADKGACAHELEALCAAERTEGSAKCQACADVPANWNKLRIVGCTDTLVTGLCAVAL